MDPGSPAAKAGLRPGDLIVRFDGLTNPDWEDLYMKVATSVNETVPGEVEREGRRLSVTLAPQPKGSDRVGYIGVLPVQAAILRAVEANMPAGRAGLQPGDRIVALDGKTVYQPAAFTDALQSGKEKEVVITVVRKGKAFDVRLKPVYAPIENGNAWRIGVELSRIPDEMVTQLPWGQAVGTSVEFCVRNALLTFEVLEKIGGPKARELLESLARQSTDNEIRDEIQRVLKRWK